MPTCSNTMLPFGLKIWKNTLVNSPDDLCGRKSVSHFFLNFNLMKCPNFAFYFPWFCFSAGLEWEGTEDSRQGPAGQMLCFQEWLGFPGYFLSYCCFYLMIFISHQQLPAQAVLGQNTAAIPTGNHRGYFYLFFSVSRHPWFVVTRLRTGTGSLLNVSLTVVNVIKGKMWQCKAHGNEIEMPVAVADLCLAVGHVPANTIAVLNCSQ